MSGPTVPEHILTELAASMRAQERGIGQTLRAREIEAVARWIESWTPLATRAEKVAAFRTYLDELDEQTRSPGEPPLREAVAQQARERLSEMERDHYWQRNGEGTA